MAETQCFFFFGTLTCQGRGTPVSAFSWKLSRYHYCLLEWGFYPSLRVEMHPFSLRRTSVSSSSFYLSFFFLLSNFFRLPLTQLEREASTFSRKAVRLIFYRISKRGQYSDCWLECTGRSRSLAGGVNCVLRAMRDEIDKIAFFSSLVMELHFSLKGVTGEYV